MAGLGSAPGPERRDFVSLSERMGYLRAMQVGFIACALAVTWLQPGISRHPFIDLILPTALYGLLIVATMFVSRLDRALALPIIGGAWLVDGLYVAWVVHASGGLANPLVILVYVHVIALTLLGSYRTGLKITAWYSLLFLVAAYAQVGGILQPAPGAGTGTDVLAVTMRHLGALWAVALATAASSAGNERELRRQNAYLEQLSAMVGAFETRRGPADIPRILLDGLQQAFSVTRGVVLASFEGDLSLVAYAVHRDPPEAPVGLDPLMERAWSLRQSVRVARLDEQTDPRLATLLPGARNVLIVPLFLDGGYRLGLLIVEFGAARGSIRRSTLAFIEQFASRATVALHNAWLLERVQQQLEENRELQVKLEAHNASLESAVLARTAELRETINQLQASDEQRRRLLNRLVGAEEDERRRIAGDIHDDPVQRLVAVDMRIQVLLRTLHDPGDLAELRELLDIVRGCTTSLRRMLFELRPAILDEEGIGAALREHLARLDWDVESNVVDNLAYEPPPDARVVLFRIAQEALANARKHANAKVVQVRLEERDGGFGLQIADDGVGFSSPGGMHSQPGHLGLSYMRERAEMAAGTCEVRSLPGAGAVVDVWVPAVVSQHLDDDETPQEGDPGAPRTTVLRVVGE